MRRFTLLLTAIVLSPVISSAQDAFFPSYSAEITSQNTQPVYSVAPPMGPPQVTPAQMAPMQDPMMMSPMTPPPVQTQQAPVYSYPAPIINQPVNQNINNPRLKPEYIPPVPTSVVVSPAGGYPGDVYLGYWQPGHYRQLTGSPYFYSAPNAGPRGPLAGNGATGSYGSYGEVTSYGTANGYPAVVNNGYSYQNSGSYGVNVTGGNSGGAGGDPYNYHFGPGYYRSGEYGHYRFPYYSYRRPWYHPGFAGYNRDTNLPW